jgi:hypothetical protein
MTSLAWVNVYFLLHQIFGPGGSWFCASEMIIMNVLTMQIMFLLCGIIISKYVFVFHLKNPMAVLEDFFAVFINIATLFLRYENQPHQKGHQMMLQKFVDP